VATGWGGAFGPTRSGRCGNSRGADEPICHARSDPRCEPWRPAPQAPTPFSYPLIRRNTTAPGQKLAPQILQVNGNGNDTRGEGGTCFGDSGGPGFEGGYVVSVVSYGYTSNCRYIDGHQRVDIGIAQDWLATFGVLPAK
jgi:hypothetical protein